MIDRRLTLRRPLSLRHTFGAIRNGAGDPCVRFDGAGFWRATRTPEGPATMLLQSESRRDLRVRAWGGGAAWVERHLNDILGDHAEDAPFDDRYLDRLAHEFEGMRIPRVHGLTELAVPIILGQRVTTREAFLAYRRITRETSELAPGPGALLLPPDPARLAATPSWWFHRHGVERKRAEAIRAVCQRQSTVDALVELPAAEARKRLLTVPGVGLWTAGILGLYGLGDHDSVIVGDYHFPNHVAWALAGEPRGDDRRMLELLEPFRGSRGRALRLVLAGASGAPKYGPRYSPLPIASF